MNNKSFATIWIIVILIIFAGGGFFGWRYFGAEREETKTPEYVRDLRRNLDMNQIKTSLIIYQDSYNIYPVSLDALAVYGTVPKDPKTGLLYQYKTLSGGQNYELCIDFEAKDDECVSSSDTEQLNSSISNEITDNLINELPSADNQASQNNVEQEVAKDVVIEAAYFPSYDGSGTIQAALKKGTMIAKFGIVNSSKTSISLESVKLFDYGSHHGSSARYSLSALRYAGQSSSILVGKATLVDQTATDSLNFGQLSNPLIIDAGASIELIVSMSDVAGLESGDTFKVAMKSIGDITYGNGTIHGIPVFAYAAPLVGDAIINK